MVCHIVSQIAELGITAGVGALVAAATEGPVGLTALAFGISALAHKIFVFMAASIGIRSNNKNVLIGLTIGTSALITAISIVAMKSLAIISTPGIVVLSLLGLTSCLINLYQMRKIRTYTFDYN